MRWRTSLRGIMIRPRLAALPNTNPIRRPIAGEEPKSSNRIGGPKKNIKQTRKNNPLTRNPRQPRAP